MNETQEKIKISKMMLSPAFLLLLLSTLRFTSAGWVLLSVGYPDAQCSTTPGHIIGYKTDSCSSGIKYICDNDVSYIETYVDTECSQLSERSPVRPNCDIQPAANATYGVSICTTSEIAPLPPNFDVRIDYKDVTCQQPETFSARPSNSCFRGEKFIFPFQYNYLDESCSGSPLTTANYTSCTSQFQMVPADSPVSSSAVPAPTKTFRQAKSKKNSIPIMSPTVPNSKPSFRSS
jgi:hypothetical protein